MLYRHSNTMELRAACAWQDRVQPTSEAHSISSSFQHCLPVTPPHTRNTRFFSNRLSKNATDEPRPSVVTRPRSASAEQEGSASDRDGGGRSPAKALHRALRAFYEVRQNAQSQCALAKESTGTAEVSKVTIRPIRGLSTRIPANGSHQRLHRRRRHNGGLDSSPGRVDVERRTALTHGVIVLRGSEVSRSPEQWQRQLPDSKFSRVHKKDSLHIRYCMEREASLECQIDRERIHRQDKKRPLKNSVAFDPEVHCTELSSSGGTSSTVSSAAHHQPQVETAEEREWVRWLDRLDAEEYGPIREPSMNRYMVTHDTRMRSLNSASLDSSITTMQQQREDSGSFNRARSLQSSGASPRSGTENDKALPADVRRRLRERLLQRMDVDPGLAAEVCPGGTCRTAEYSRQHVRMIPHGNSIGSRRIGGGESPRRSSRGSGNDTDILNPVIRTINNHDGAEIRADKARLVTLDCSQEQSSYSGSGLGRLLRHLPHANLIRHSDSTGTTAQSNGTRKEAAGLSKLGRMHSPRFYPSHSSLVYTEGTTNFRRAFRRRMSNTSLSDHLSTNLLRDGNGTLHESGSQAGGWLRAASLKLERRCSGHVSGNAHVTTTPSATCHAESNRCVLTISPAPDIPLRTPIGSHEYEAGGLARTTSRQLTARGTAIVSYRDEKPEAEQRESEKAYGLFSTRKCGPLASADDESIQQVSVDYAEDRMDLQPGNQCRAGSGKWRRRNRTDTADDLFEDDGFSDDELDAVLARAISYDTDMDSQLGDRFNAW